MARIKFLDVLEETKSNTRFESTSNNIQAEPTYSTSERDFSGFQDRFPQKERVFDGAHAPSEKQSNHQTTQFREQRKMPEFIPPTRESRMAFEYGSTIPNGPVRKSTETSSKSQFDFEDNRTLFTGALFVLFGGMLFLSGYWFGKNVTERIKTENLALLTESSNNYNSNPSKTLDVSDLPVITPVEDLPKKEIKVVEPVISDTPKKKKIAPKPTPAPKPIQNKEYVIQVSTHSSIDAARKVEDALRVAGFSAYTSENVVGNSVYFRVRIRGFQNRSNAEKILNDVKSTGMGSDGYVLTLD